MYVGLKQPRGDGERYVTPARAAAKETNERVARVGYNHFISNKDKWNNCFSKFSNRVLPPIFIYTILQSKNF